MDLMTDLLRRLGYDLATFANVLQVILRASLVTDGRRVRVVIAAGTTSAAVPHGLNRVYQGALVETQSAALDRFRVLPAGDDSATLLRVEVSSAPPTDVTLSMWCY